MKMIKGLAWVKRTEDGLTAYGYELSKNKKASNKHVEQDGTFWYWYIGEIKRAKYDNATTNYGRVIADMIIKE